MEEEKKLTAAEKRKMTLAKKQRVDQIMTLYERLAAELPSEWVRNEDSKIELVKTIHKEILGLDKEGHLRPMGDFVRFMAIASQAGLNPFLNEIYGLYFWDSSIKGDKLTVITGINGFRKAAAGDTEAAMRYVGSGEPEFEMKTIQPDWADAEEEVPHKCTVKIFGMNPVTGEPTVVATGIAFWDEYVKMVDEYGDNRQKTGRKIPNTSWRTKKLIMLKKCAEADGLRKAYPNRLNSVYERTEFDHVAPPSKEEIDQQENDRVTAINEQLAKRRQEKGGVFAKNTDDINEGEVVENA